MQVPTSINQACTLCGNPCAMWCSRCQNTWYCCPEHLQTDWPRHRRDCISVSHNTTSGYSSNMIATPPPAEPQYITVTAILFAPEADRWTTTQVHCRPTPRSSNGICPIPILQMFFPDGLTEGIVLTQGLNGENLRFPLHLWYSPTALQRSSPVNRSIYNITCGSASKAWCGPVVVLKFNGSRRQGYTDASPNDLPALSAYFLAYK
ncbi:MAG: hypothetical protein NXY57DRAFT_1008487 [Lentinula lateritia]|uniref:MYND-type domain-containing protein n=1 Tax=Lentinula lateritia TaxID=40482 RepID=A0ABQ8VC58_9AGAR|nr:hypothetical protein EV359DRAFT_74100 [Lentinula novae-zelandiae]KAJ3931189.1 MAG: hypothetical protein NXY57DRAFT_1008487 [Lentinula lateritia]KAJ4486938.1 hypothetical protein C8R41DRAFT_837203 [Lentinula lateritia]